MIAVSLPAQGVIAWCPRGHLAREPRLGRLTFVHSRLLTKVGTFVGFRSYFRKTRWSGIGRAGWRSDLAGDGTTGATALALARSVKILRADTAPHVGPTRSPSRRNDSGWALTASTPEPNVCVVRSAEMA